MVKGPYDQLSQGLKQLELPDCRNKIEQMLEYISLLAHWSRAYNLTGIKTFSEMIDAHVLDSLTLTPHLAGKRFLDVGSGAGLPGMPLAIMLPDMHFTLLDSNGKKTRFLFQVRSKLGLRNVEEVNQRVEKYMPEKHYDMILTRAFSKLPKMLESCKHLAKTKTIFLAMKGKQIQSELDSLPEGYEVLSIKKISLPGVSRDRHLIKIATQKGQEN